MFKKIISAIITFVMIVSIINTHPINSYASSDVNVDVDKKVISIYMMPYSGFKVENVIDSSYSVQSGKLDFRSIIVNAKITDKSTGNVLKSSDIVNSKTEYSLEVRFTTESVNYPPMDYTGYSAKVINESFPDNTSFCKNAKSEVKGTESMVFTCDFTVSDPPKYDLGVGVIDLSKGLCDYSDDVDYSNALLKTLDYLTDNEIISYVYKPGGSGFDFDFDGAIDLYYNRNKRTFDKPDDCKFSGTVFYTLTDELNEEISGKGEYHFNSLRVVYSNQDFTDSTVHDIPDVVYTGSELCPTPEVFDSNGDKLVKDEDYTVSYKNNVNVGKGTVIITGINGYEGTLTKEFNIIEPKKDDKSDNDSSDGSKTGGNGGQDTSDGSKTGGNGGQDTSVPVLNGKVHGDLESGLWVELPDGTYPKNMWGIVNGKKYYFDARGYAAANEYADGKWFDASGTLNEAYAMTWKSNETGWWIEDMSGWYPISKWLKIDGYWYYFTETGYMDYSEYRDGCWLGADGAWVEEYANGHWCSDSYGWWYEDNGWYPVNQYLWIDGVKYWFDSDGYWR